METLGQNPLWQTRIEELLELSNHHVTENRRTRLTAQQRWDAIEEVELAHMFFMRDVHNEFARWWGAMFVRMVMEYLLDNGRFRRDDFDAALAMLEEESQKAAFVPH